MGFDELIAFILASDNWIRTGTSNVATLQISDSMRIKCERGMHYQHGRIHSISLEDVYVGKDSYNRSYTRWSAMYVDGNRMEWEDYKLGYAQAAKIRDVWNRASKNRADTSGTMAMKLIRSALKG